jgi:hypothetical protein
VHIVPEQRLKRGLVLSARELRDSVQDAEVGELLSGGEICVTFTDGLN